MRTLLLLIVPTVSLIIPITAWSDQVYLSYGTYGEASFSDTAHSGSVSLNYEVYRPVESAAAEEVALVQQQRELADKLENARLDREAGRAKARTERAIRRTLAIQEESGVYPHPEYYSAGISYSPAFHRNRSPRTHNRGNHRIVRPFQPVFQHASAPVEKPHLVTSRGKLFPRQGDRTRR